MSAIRSFLCAVILFSVVGCGGQRSGALDARSASNVILGHNTDPRFSIVQQRGGIGTVWPDGNKVFLNQKNIRNKKTLNNFDFVHTGDDSAAKLEFYPDSAQCDIYISEFSYGRLFGDTNDCNHELESRHAFVEAPEGRTEYHVKVKNRETVVTVLSGALIAGPLRNPGRAEEFEPGSEAIISRNRIKRVRELSKDQLWQRIEWLDYYKFGSGKSQSKSPGILGKILMGVGAAIIGRELYNRSKDNNDNKTRNKTPDTSSSNTDPQDEEIGPD